MENTYVLMGIFAFMMAGCTDSPRLQPIQAPIATQQLPQEAVSKFLSADTYDPNRSKCTNLS